MQPLIKAVPTFWQSACSSPCQGNIASRSRLRRPWSLRGTLFGRRGSRYQAKLCTFGGHLVESARSMLPPGVRVPRSRCGWPRPAGGQGANAFAKGTSVGLHPCVFPEERRRFIKFWCNAVPIEVSCVATSGAWCCAFRPARPVLCPEPAGRGPACSLIVGDAIERFPGPFWHRFRPCTVGARARSECAVVEHSDVR